MLLMLLFTSLILDIPPDGVGPAPATVASLRNLCSTGKPDLNLVELTIAEAHEALLEGRTTCTRLLEAHLQRIAAFDRRLNLNAIIALNHAAHQRAEALDAALLEIKRTGNSTVPPLFCIPMLIKDNIDYVGIPTTAGSVSLKDNYPLKTANVVERMESQGALLIAKSNMGELAFFPAYCVSSISGAVRNPYHLGHTSAGSSGGSAAGLAASFALLGLGTDTGNSVRGPASHQALVGIRPTLGLIGRSGIIPLRWDRDTVGPMSRTVRDAAVALGAMVGIDPSDNMTQILMNVTLPSDYTQFLNLSALQGARIGIFTQISDLPGGDPEIHDMFITAVRDLRAAGAVLVDDFRIIGNSLGLDWHANRYGDGPALGHWHVNGRFEDLWACQAPLRVGVDEYLATGNNSRTYISLASIFASGEHHPQAGDDIAAALRAGYGVENYPPPALRQLGFVCGCGPWWTDSCRSEFRKRFIQSMDALNLDAIIYPTWSSKPLVVGDPGQDQYYDGNNSPMVAPHVGAPAVTVPMGHTADGLPGGLQFLARPFDEGKLLGIAYAYEQATMRRQPPPLFPECMDEVSERFAQLGLAGK